jgi:hypothetical protein
MYKQIADAFAELDRRGIIALQNAGYTMSDGWSDVAEKRHRAEQSGQTTWNGSIDSRIAITPPAAATKKASKKKTAKKSTKRTAKTKTSTKKSPAKKMPAEKATKKTPAKKATKKTPAKKSTKKPPAKQSAKKAARR